MDLGDDALVGGVDHVEGLAFLAFDELIVDEAGGGVSEDVGAEPTPMGGGRCVGE